MSLLDCQIPHKHKNPINSMTYLSLTLYIKHYKIGKRKNEPQFLGRAMCVLAVYNKAQAQRISKREFKPLDVSSGD